MTIYAEVVRLNCIDWMKKVFRTQNVSFRSQEDVISTASCHIQMFMRKLLITYGYLEYSLAI